MSSRNSILQITLQVIGAILMVVGSVVFVMTFIPLLNPTQYRLNSGGDAPSLWRYLVGTVVSIFILTIAYYLSRRRDPVIDTHEPIVDYYQMAKNDDVLRRRPPDDPPGASRVPVGRPKSPILTGSAAKKFPPEDE